MAGRCSCGLVKHFVDYSGSGKHGYLELVDKVAKLNEKSIKKWRENMVTSVTQTAPVSTKEHQVAPNSITLPPVPEKPGKPASTHAMSDYYTKHREQIFKEIELIGVNATLKRWGMSGNTLYCMRHPEARERYTEQYRKKAQGETKSIDVVTKQAVSETKSIDVVTKQAISETKPVNVETTGTPCDTKEHPSIPQDTKAVGLKPDLDMTVLVRARLIPNLPDWNGAWGDEVKLAWFEAFELLVNLQGGNGKKF